jgi:hypothetical protein
MRFRFLLPGIWLGISLIAFPLGAYPIMMFAFFPLFDDLGLLKREGFFTPKPEAYVYFFLMFLVLSVALGIFMDLWRVHIGKTSKF